MLIRAGLMLFEDLNKAIIRTYNDYSVFGFSVFCDQGLSLRETYEARFQLNGQHKLRTATAGDIRALGFEVSPTFDEGHFTIVLREVLTPSNYSALNGAFSQAIDIRYVT